MSLAAAAVRTGAELHRLDNGLRVVVAPDHLVPAVAVDVWYDVGSRHEEPGRTGFAHLFEHLMFQGSRNVAPTEHFEALQAIGATLNATTGFDRTNYFETVPTHAFELALWLEADRMGTLLEALTQANLDNQRDVVKNERRQGYDNVPYGTAWEHVFAALFPDGHPYHHLPIGSMADLDAASVADAQAFFRRHYAPGNAVIAIVGDIEPSAALDAVDRYFGRLVSLGDPPAAPDGAIGVRDAAASQTLYEDVPAESLYLAHRLPPDGDRVTDAAEVALEVLTGGAASRLQRRLIREQQLAQAVTGGTQGLVGGADVGVIIAQASSGASLDDLTAALDDEIAGLAADGPTDEEMVRARARIERAWLGEVSTVLGRADELCRAVCLFDDVKRVETTLDRLAAVTPDAVQRAAAERLTSTNRVVLEYRHEDGR